MKKQIFIFQVFFCLLGNTTIFAANGKDKPGNSALKEKAQEWMQKQPVVAFLENKGQMTNESGNPIPFVLFKAQMPGLDIYLTQTGFTYIFYKLPEDDEHKNSFFPLKREEAMAKLPDEKKKKPKAEWERIEMTLSGAAIKKENILTGKSSQTDFNFFYSHCPGGIYGVKASSRITIKEVYPGIDWVIYTSEKKGFTYDFIAHPGADPNQIEIVYSSLNKLNLNENGTIEIQTKLGILTEAAPVSYQAEKIIPSRFLKTINRKNDKGGYEAHLQFSINSYDKTQTLVIDPIVIPNLIWGTYYGGSSWSWGGSSGSGVDGLCSIAADAVGNLYASGYVRDSQFPVFNLPGGYYSGVYNGGMYDMAILKFSSAGARLWVTYYGGTDPPGSLSTEGAMSLTTDPNNNLYVTGYTSNYVGFPLQNLAGAYNQTVFGGGSDAFILKFNGAGVRQWATFYGGNGSDIGHTIASDANGNIFITGETNSTNLSIVSGGGYNQPPGGANDAFIAKFNNMGIQQWSSYYGGSGADVGNALALDGTGNVYVTGETGSANLPVLNLAGAYNQPAKIGAADDAFILKFNNAGVRQWATYYGGNKNEGGFSIATDANANVFIMGQVDGAGFPTYDPGGGAYYQAAFGGGTGWNITDLFLLKFDNTGVRQWATYYGGSGKDGVYGSDRDREIIVDATGDLFVTGITKSTDFPTQNSGGFFNAAMLGGGDAFILQFSNTGVRKWATYQGATNNPGGFTVSDFGSALAIDPVQGCLYVGGEWWGSGSNGLKNPGAPAYYDGVFNNGVDAGDDMFIMKFCSNCTKPTAALTATPAMCTKSDGTATVLPSGGTSPYTYVWNPSGQTTSSATGLSTGTYTILVKEGGGCSDSFTVTVTQQTVAITATPLTTPSNCGNNTGTINVTAGGGTLPYTYSWNPPAGTSASASGLGAGSYTLTVTDNIGCEVTTVATISSINGPAITSVAPFDVLCNSGTDGSATVTITNGTAPYTYSWSGGSAAVTSSLTSSISSQPAATYFVTITDANGCQVSTNVTITEPVAIVPPTFTTTNATCGKSDGSAITSSSGGTGILTYNWNIPATGTAVTNLSVGIYIVTVMDANNCTKTASVSIVNVGGLTTTTSGTPVLCNGGNTGTATATVTNGTPPYTYSWSNGISSVSGSLSDQLTNLSVDTYTITVTDSKGCSSISTVTLIEPAILTLVPLAYDAGCSGNNGSAVANAKGGTAQYTYSWSNGLVTDSIFNLSAGAYSITITDAKGCSTSANITVGTEMSTPITIIPAQQFINYGGHVDIIVTSSGGNSLTYTWTPAFGLSCTDCANPVATPVISTIYTVTVNDADGCQRTAMIDIIVKQGCSEDDSDAFIANIFSPNNDGKNDILYIEGNGLTNIYWAIYDRWGNLLFEAFDQTHGWNGTKKGNPMESGTYVYYLKATCIKTNTEIKLKGNVSIVK
ncbi:MAG: gliding motility-associated C-terminal domain-containing protein [Bacteroidetes bacterium]|nr:gliding motility-associated C-terminal domain-containing protein [Bacteroidota bacterium]